MTTSVKLAPILVARARFEKKENLKLVYTSIVVEMLYLRCILILFYLILPLSIGFWLLQRINRQSKIPFNTVNETDKI